MSSQLRRSIGIARKHLLRALQSYHEDLQSDITKLLPTATNEDLIEYTELQATHHEAIATKLTTLDNLNKKWIALMTEDQNEVTIFHEYISRYGDYRDEIQQAIDALQRLDEYALALTDEHEKRGIPHHSITTSASHHPSKDETPYRTEPRLPSHIDTALHHQHQPLLVATSLADPRRPTTHDDSTFNYFDASLLTRLELPSFTGNLLEFPEFWARYHALIHCKTTISDATKFSLLKSCLKGRALHAIDGLPVTNENYATAIDILRTTYDNPSTLRHLIYTQLLNLPRQFLRHRDALLLAVDFWILGSDPKRFECSACRDVALARQDRHSHLNHCATMASDPVLPQRGRQDGVEHVLSYSRFRTSCPFRLVGGTSITLTSSSRPALRRRVQTAALVSSVQNGMQKGIFPSSLR